MNSASLAPDDAELDLLARKSRAGDEAAKEDLLRAFAPTIRRQGSRLWRGSDRREIEVAGALGVLRALEGWDGERPFRAFGRAHLVGAMLRHVRDEGPRGDAELDEEDHAAPVDAPDAPAPKARRRRARPLLTPGQSRVLQGYATVGTADEVAALLNISRRTVNGAVQECYDRLEVRHLHLAILKAARLGLIVVPTVPPSDARR